MKFLYFVLAKIFFKNLHFHDEKNSALCYFCMGCKPHKPGLKFLMLIMIRRENFNETLAIKTDLKIKKHLVLCCY